MDEYLLGIVRVTGVLAVLYLGWRLVHSMGGKGGNVGPADIFLAVYCSVFLCFIAMEFWDIEPGLLLLALMGIMFPIMWVLMTSDTVRGSLWNGIKSFVGLS